MSEPATLLSALAAAAVGDRGVRFLATEGSARFGWADVLSLARSVSVGLAARGVAPGDRVALVLPTGIDFFAGFFGALAAGAVPVPLYPPVRLGRLDEYHASTARMLARVRARLVATDRRAGRLLGPSLAAARPALGVAEVAHLGAEAPVAPGPLREGEPDELALVQFSSGSTVDPKPVALTHRQLLANVRAIAAAILAAYPEERGLHHTCASWLPLYHDMGLVGCVLVSVYHGRELTLLPPELFVARPASWLRAISDARATISAAPSFAYALAAERVRDEDLVGVDLSSWRLALDGAEPVVTSALERFASRFSRYGLRAEALTPVYGLAEAALAVTFSSPSQPFVARAFDERSLALGGVAVETPGGRTLVSLGQPLDGYELRIAGERGEPLPSGRLGRVLVRGPSVMRGYLDDPVATAAVLRHGWLDTGDLGFLHTGELYLYGRAKDVVIVRGRKYDPQRFEQALDEVEGARRGCAVATSDVVAGEEGLVIFLERARRARAPDDVALAGAARSAIVERTGVLPAAVVVLAPGTLPRTSSGKLRRGETLRRWRAGLLSPPRRVTRAALLRELVRSVWLRRRTGRARP